MSTSIPPIVVERAYQRLVSKLAAGEPTGLTAGQLPEFLAMLDRSMDDLHGDVMAAIRECSLEQLDSIMADAKEQADDELHAEWARVASGEWSGE